MKKAKGLFLFGVMIAVLCAAVPLILMLCVPQKGSVGIIGGTGAPTYWLIVYSVLNGWPVYGWILSGVLLVASLILFIRKKAWR